MKKTQWLVLLALVSLLLTGCRKQADADSTGGDWRTWGQVSDTAAFETEDGGQVRLLLCVFPENAVLYYDDAAQTAFAQLQYPYALPDAQTAYSSVTLFGDGDAHPEVQIEFSHDDGTQTTFIWQWNGEEYAYSSELSHTGAQDREASRTDAP